jgi:hypothetical protein
MDVFYFYDGGISGRKRESLETALHETFNIKGQHKKMIESPISEKEDVIHELIEINKRSSFCRGLIDIKTITGMISQSGQEESCGEKVILYIKNTTTNEITGVIIVTFDYFDEHGEPNNTNDYMFVHFFCTPVSGGFGKVLMQVCIELGKKADSKQISLSSTLPAVTFYEHMGFELTPESRAEYRRSPPRQAQRANFLRRMISSVYTGIGSLFTRTRRRSPKRSSVFEMVYRYKKDEPIVHTSTSSSRESPTGRKTCSKPPKHKKGSSSKKNKK